MSSLAIISTTDTLGAVKGSNTAYRFNNNYEDPIIIEPDSEVALVSLKCVRQDHTITID